MGVRVRGWLAAAVAVALAAALLVLANWPVAEPSGALDGGLVAGRAVPADVTTTTTSDRVEADPDAIRDLLARRAQAVLARSEAEFMATVDPQADPAFVTAQRELFRNLDGVPLRHWSYQLSPTGSLPVPPGLPDPGEYYAPRTTLRYALAGIDAEPTSRPMAYLYVHRAGGWLLTSDTALDATGEKTWRGMWDFGPCKVLPVASGLLLGHPGTDDRAFAEYAAELDAAVGSVTEVWGTGWSQRVAVLLPGTVDEMRALVGPSFNVEGIAAAAVADKVDVANGVAVGQRVVLNPSLTAKLSPAARRIVLRHEITHVASRASTVDGAPMWLLEGFADYVGYRGSGLEPREAAPDLVRALRGGQPPTALPVAADFVGGSANLDLAYQLAWSAALYVVDLVGEDGLVALYRTVAGDPTQDGATLPDAVRTVLGVEFDAFVAGWLASLPPRFG